MTPKTHDWEKEDYDEYRREIVRRSQAKRRQMAKRYGMCSICCSRQARPGRKTCVACSERAKAYSKIYHQMKKGNP